MRKLDIAVVMLNYNSADDLFKCMTDLKKQKGINLITIVVDNASKQETVDKIKFWSKENFPEAISGIYRQVLDLKNKKDVASNTFFIYNNKNNGYSAGNNIGIELADSLNVDAVLIANPDMQFPNEQYIYKLANELMSDDKYYVIGSKIVGLDGKDQSPIRESTFMEELLWPLQLLPKFFKTTSYVLPYNTNKIMEVPKIMGCSLMLKMSFLRQIGYFDKNVFLYSEEAILSSQVTKYNGRIIFDPTVEAIHAHIRSQKENSSLRMLHFIKSRKYYIEHYSGYSKIQKLLLKISYNILSVIHKFKFKFKGNK